MKKVLMAAMLVSLTIISVQDALAYFGDRLCSSGRFQCIRVMRGDTWVTLFPDSAQRDNARRLNRTNEFLHPGMLIAVPNGSYMSMAPFEHSRQAEGRKVIVVDPNRLAFGAYDGGGNLVHWGPISAGKGFCPDVHRRCITHAGVYTIYTKQGPGCISTKFPVGRGGAPMPYCMFFHGGYALHGSYEVPGYNASHGCVRMFVNDARWLNQEFIDVGGTKVIIRPYGA